MRFYEDLCHLSENRCPPRAYYIPYDSLDKALMLDRSHSAYYKLLNGDWDFAWYAQDVDVINPCAVPVPALTPVPSGWECHGYGRPGYQNVIYPHPLDMP